MSAELFPPRGASVVRVALPVPVEALFSYAVPAELEAAARIGCRVLVPFERRRLTGVIAALGGGDGPPVARLRRLVRLLDVEPVLSTGLVEILLEAARDVFCPPGLALATALPPGALAGSRPGYRMTARGDAALRSGAARGTERALLERLAGGPRDTTGLARGQSDARQALERLARDRLIEHRAIERGEALRPRSRRVASLAAGVDVEAEVAGSLRRAPRQGELLRELADGPRETAELSRLHPGGGAALRSLRERGLVRVEELPVSSPVVAAYHEETGVPDLNDAQRNADAEIGGAIEAGRFAPFLLHGVTGSGKTEVYLRAVERALARDRQALVLVPEITLTHQIVARLRGRFGDRLAVLHSGLPRAERLDQWQRLKSGITPIAVGARSALFAPLEKLGVLVMDEEHEPAYKNEEGFRYHARDLAERLARVASCPLVLGSATPALETRHAAESGVLRRIALPHRIGGHPLPAVQLVDLTRERAHTPRGRRPVLSRALRHAMRDTLDAGGQIILFLNRRGFSTQILCFRCQHVERCKHCDIALVYHSTDDRLRCHYCDFNTPPPQLCSGCGAPDTALLGLGTERLEEEVHVAFPAARVARLDRDASGRRGATEKILAALRDGAIDVLVGTQMVAKGHDFPGVRLVGVVNADLGLHFPDFRAAERTFQLLTQVAGRAGRGGDPGRVVIQSHTPDHYAIRAASGHDYERFYDEELEHRRKLGYPPFGHLVLAHVSSLDEDRAREAADTLARSAGPVADVELLGPVPASIPRLRDRYRFQLLLKGADADAVRRVGRRIADATARLPASVRAFVDVHPVNVL